MSKISLKILTFLFVVFNIFSSCQSTDSDEREFYGPPEERNGDKAMKSFAESYGKEHHLKFIHVGRKFETHPKAVFALWMADFSPKTIEEGRALAVNFVNAFWAEIQKNPKIDSFFEHYCKIEPKYYKPPMKLGYVYTKIAFWDKDVNRPKAPYLAEIIFYDNTFYYYEADPKTEALRFLSKETYEQATHVGSK